DNGATVVHHHIPIVHDHIQVAERQVPPLPTGGVPPRRQAAPRGGHRYVQVLFGELHHRVEQAAAALEGLVRDERPRRPRRVEPVGEGRLNARATTGGPAGKEPRDDPTGRPTGGGLRVGQHPP